MCGTGPKFESTTSGPILIPQQVCEGYPWYDLVGQVRDILGMCDFDEATLSGEIADSLPEKSLCFMHTRVCRSEVAVPCVGG